ncbi:MAG: DUF6691 family protein [Cellulosilyticaceae bacterium]
MMELVLAVILGALFGFVLYRIGASDGDRLLGMLRLKDLRLMKTILLGIGIANVLIFASSALGVMDVSHFSIKALNIGVIVGGAIFGLGWGIAGYCPGTGVTAMGAGKKDAVMYVLGGLVGALVYNQAYPYFESLGWFQKLFGGVETLVQVSEKSLSLLPIGNIWGMGLGIILIVLAIVLPEQVTVKKCTEGACQ